MEVVADRNEADARTPASPAQLYALLAETHRPANDGVETFSLVTEALGVIRSVSGVFVICDPLVRGVRLPQLSAQSGSVLVIRRLAADNARVGIALLRLSDAHPTSWRHLGEYGVSTGMSCFADPEALDALDRRSAVYYEQPGALEGEEPLVDAMASSDAVRYDVDDNHHLAAFRAGIGDGVYDAWAGLDDDGQPCIALTSFDNIAAQTAPR